MKIEIKPIKIPKLDGYYCSRDGQIFSLKSGYLKRLRTVVDRYGYEKISFYKEGGRSNTQYIYRTVHTLVLSIWGPTRPKGMECNHKNGNRLDNRIENLEWVTTLENIRHSITVLKKDMRGSKHPSAKITEQDVFKMKELRALGYSYEKIARQFNLGRSQTTRIIKGKKWSHTVSSPTP